MYKTIVLELLQRHPAVHEQLRKKPDASGELESRRQ